MISAKVVLKDKFWMLQKEGVSVGTLRFEADHISVMLDGNPLKFANINEAKSTLEIIDSATLSTSGTTQLQGAYGYPTDLEQVFNLCEDQGLPCYTKAKNSKVVHAAGWYGMQRNGLHAEAFCPKVNTLKTYPYIGPFKSQTDLRVAMTSWKRNDKSGSNTARQVLS